MEQETLQKDVENQDVSVLVDPEIISINLICRLCANPNERSIGIYSEEGISNDLANKMNLYLPIKVTENDTLPLQCCWSCASTVLAWHELIVASVEADRRLRTLQVTAEKDPIIEDYSGMEDSVPSPQEDRSDPKTPAPAPSLNVFYQEAAAQTVTSSIKTKRGRPPKKKSAPTNTKKDDWRIAEESLQKYIDTIHNPLLHDKDILDKTEASVKGNVRIELIECGLDQVPIKIEGSSLDEAKAYNFSCQYCNLLFIDEDDIVNHVKTAHPEEQQTVEEEPTTTGEEPTKTTNKIDRRKNTKLDRQAINDAKIVVDGRVYYICQVCGRSLHSPYTYNWHMRIHTGERPFVCDLCGKQFRVSQGLVRHLRETHEGIKNFGCDLCGRMFATRRNVEEHRRIHTNERPYVCDLCGKSFKQKASLFVHKRSHKDTFPFRCSYCNQGFRTRPPLLIHITRHTGEKPYPCDVCGRRFRIKYELKRHKLIHSEEKPFVCNECGLNFRQKRYLKNHYKINHNRSGIPE